MNRFVRISKTIVRRPVIPRLNVPVAARCTSLRWQRMYNTPSSPSLANDGQRMEEAMNHIEELFSAAKDEMEYAQESAGSVYYHQDRETAEKAVRECLDAFDEFLNRLPTDEMRNEVQTKVGMKMKELKMEFEALPH